MAVYECEGVFEGCWQGFNTLHAYSKHLQRHYFNGDIKYTDIKKYNIYPGKIFQMDMRMVNILNHYLDGLYNPIITVADDIMNIYKKEIDNWKCYNA